MERAALARRVLALIDLTDLGDSTTAENVAQLCRRAVGPHGSTAAVCIWPEFVAQAAAALAGTGVRVATVVNFPHGGDDVDPVVQMTQAAMLDGADDIDLVLPYHAFLEGRLDDVTEMLIAVRAYVPEDKVLKVILETGELPSQSMVAAAADVAIEHGADFIKTSTGKTPVSATLDAVMTMLGRIEACGRTVGIKPSGGIRTVEDAATYLTLAEEVMGAGWATPATFRFGASGLLDAVEAALEGSSSVGSSSGDSSGDSAKDGY